MCVIMIIMCVMKGFVRNGFGLMSYGGVGGVRGCWIE